jgi:hypothetical protein
MHSIPFSITAGNQRKLADTVLLMVPAQRAQFPTSSNGNDKCSFAILTVRN